MNKLKSFCLLALLALSSFSVLLAQNTQPTPYQKKQLELSKKYFQIFYGYRMTMADEVFYEQLAQGEDAQEFLLAMGILGYAMSNTEAQVKKVLTQMKNEYAAAEKLKNATDFRLEKEVKARKEQAEKERKLRAEQEAYAKTDVGSIQKNIKSDFEKWNQKGEFEKEADYAKRLQIQSRTAYDGICLEKIKSKINGFSSYYWTKELSTYNSENEFFTVSFKINGVEWQSKINIPISQAENFKNNYSNLKMKIDDYNWCFVENSLCPTLVTLESERENSKYEFPLTLQNQSEILYYFDDFEIDNSYLKGYIFKFSNAKAIAEQVEKEKQRLDSLELATYNQKLDSIFKDYNRQLLQNTYNLNQKVMTDYNKVTSKDRREYNFNSSVSSIKSNFERLNNEFNREYENEYRKNGKLFIGKNEFDTFYKQGKDIYPQEIEKRTILNYLTTRAQLVETMNFQKEKKESVGSTLGRGLLGVATGTNVSAKDYTNENEIRRTILSLINESEDKSYYPQIMDFVIETNKGINREWTKNGQHFESKSEFYNAYLSDNYKDVLKDNKKKQKR